MPSTTGPSFGARMNAMMTLNAGLQARNAGMLGAGATVRASALPLANAVTASGIHALLNSREAAKFAGRGASE